MKNTCVIGTLLDLHTMCPHGWCHKCSGYCRDCEKEFWAKALCGLPIPTNLMTPKNSKKTVRRVMREEEDLTPHICDSCHKPIFGNYATLGGAWVPAIAPKTYHPACVPTVALAPSTFSSTILDARLAAGERGVPKIPNAADTRHAKAEVGGSPVRFGFGSTPVTPHIPNATPYGSVHRLLESHRDLLAVLRYIKTQDPNAKLNWAYIDRVILGGENATK